MAGCRPPKAMKVAERRGSICDSVSGRGRQRSGEVEAVREFDPGRAGGSINVHCSPGRGSGSTKRCVTRFRVLRFHAGDNEDET